MTPGRIGLVVHPTRDVSGPRDTLLGWAHERGWEVFDVGVTAEGGDRRTAAADDCRLLVAIGGDGTVLGGARLAARVFGGVPVLGVACGSLGMLAGTAGGALRDALDRYAVGEWEPRRLEGLRVADETGAEAVALNDVVVVRKGAGQVKVEVLVGGDRYVRLAGDGVVVSTQSGSSAYGMAAGGPILAPGIKAVVVTPLHMHGGSAPPLVVPAATTVSLRLEHGYSRARVEVDGQPSPIAGERLDLRLEPDYVTLVAFADSEPHLTGLRRRSIVLDSPRIVAHDERTAAGQPRAARGPGSA